MHPDDYNVHGAADDWRRPRRLHENDKWIPHMRAQLARIRDARIVRRHLRLLTVLAAAAVVLALGYAGKLSLDEARQDQATYCSMVKQKLWPDFRHTYKEECQRPHR